MFRNKSYVTVQILVVINICTTLHTAYGMQLSEICNPPIQINAYSAATSTLSLASPITKLICNNIHSDIVTSNAILLEDSGVLEEADITPALLTNVYNYPNPFKSAAGTRIGYKLSKDMNIKIRIYDLQGYEIFTISCPLGHTGGSTGYNKVMITEHLNPGVYLYLIIHEGKVLGKSRMMVQP